MRAVWARVEAWSIRLQREAGVLLPLPLLEGVAVPTCGHAQNVAFGIEQQWQAAALPGGQAAFLQQLFQWAPAAANAQVFTAPTRAHEEIHRLAQCRFELQASQTGGQAQWCEAVPLKLPVSR